MNKYRAVRTELDGIKFDSKKEAARYLDLRLLLFAREIKDLQIHPSWNLEVAGQKICRYAADFAYRDKQGQFIVEDVKSGFTRKLPAYRLKKKLMKAIWDIDIQEV